VKFEHWLANVDRTRSGSVDVLEWVIDDLTIGTCGGRVRDGSRQCLRTHVGGLIVGR